MKKSSAKNTLLYYGSKKADDRDAIIFRLLNNTPNSVKSGICVNGAHLPLDFGKYEVKTVLYENGTLTESYEIII